MRGQARDKRRARVGRPRCEDKTVKEPISRKKGESEGNKAKEWNSPEIKYRRGAKGMARVVVVGRAGPGLSAHLWGSADEFSIFIAGKI